MAVIGSIRKQSTFLVIIIGVALAAFVLGDFARGGRGSREVNIGVVEGDEITYMDFNAKVEQNIEATKQQQQRDRLDADQTYRLRNDTWDQMVSDILLKNEYDKLGLGVSSEELFDLVQGNDPHPLIKQYFADPETGIYNRNLVIEYLKGLDNMPAESKAQWVNFEQYIKNDKLRSKYNNLISKGYYWPRPLAKTSYAENNDKARMEFVSKKYTDIADTLVQPTDADYEKQYEKQKEKFKQEAWRDVDYVVFDIVPSERDMNQAKANVDALYEDMRKTTDLMRFVMVNSDRPYDSAWKVEGQLPVQIDSIMFNSEVGTTVPPYLVSNTYYISRLADVAMRPDSLKATHILIAYRGAFRAAPETTRTKVAAEALADSLAGVLKKSPGQMKELAVQLSDDPSAQTNNGDLGWFADGAMVNNFNEAVIDNKVGAVVVAETPFGYHVIKVDDKKKPVKKVRVATVVREVVPSNETYQQTYAKASKLASENRTLTDFDIAVEDERMNKRTAPRIGKMDNTITGLNYPRQIVRWAFDENTETGQVSEVFDLEGQFVVAVVTDAGEEGYPELDEVRSRLTPFVYNDLKAKIIMDDINSSDKNMEALKEEDGFNSSRLAALLFTSRNLTGFGQENEVIGTVFGLNEGEEYGPIEGRGGVFMVKLEALTKAEEKESYVEVTDNLERTWSSRVNQGFAYNALRDAADLEDNRYLFY
ncbi:MAG: SurA N-terminal domain-containing protein [bacterium]